MNAPDPASLDSDLRQVSRASASLIDALRAYLDGHLAEAAAIGVDISLPAWGDRVLSELWERMNAAGVLVNPRPLGILAFSQAIEDITDHLNGAAWAKVHKGVHYYNVGLAFTAMMEIDRAFKFFLLADEQDEKNKAAQPGDIFREKDLFAGLRERFFEPWLDRTKKNYNHDSCTSPSDRLGLLVRLLAALPGRHVLARCHLGVFRACLIQHQAHAGLPPFATEYLLAVEDLAVLTEAACRMLDEGKTAYGRGKLTLGDTLKGGTPVGRLGFVLGPAMDLDDEAASKALIAQATNGDKQPTARIVQMFRNLTAHPGDPQAWILDTAVLADVVAVQLDFATAIASAFETAHGPLATVAAAVPAVTATSALGAGPPVLTDLAPHMSGSSERPK